MALYNLDFVEKGKYKVHIKKFLLFPEFWNDPKNEISVKLKWNSIKFSKVNKSKLPTKKGIYAFVLMPKYDNFFETRYLFYAGKTNRTLKKRFSEYLNEKDGKGKPRNKIFEMLNLYDGYMYFFYSEIVKSTDVDDCENCILDTFVPHVNTQIPVARIKPELKNIYE